VTNANDAERGRQRAADDEAEVARGAQRRYPRIGLLDELVEHELGMDRVVGQRGVERLAGGRRIELRPHGALVQGLRVQVMRDLLNATADRAVT
jgi:hypothetical protein